jgi:hypothetical protein
MSKVSISGNASGTGVFTIASPNGNTDRTLTLPDATGTILTTATPGVPVNGPAFSAYASVATTVSNATWTKIAFQIEEYDTNNNYDKDTNYRFQPTVAGYYQVTGQTTYGILLNTIWALAAIYKNGSAYKYGVNSLGTGNGLLVNSSSLVYLNGSTDFVELYSYQNSGSSQSSGTANANASFQAALIRSAT